MHGRPAVEPIAHIRRGTLLASHVDHVGDEALLDGSCTCGRRITETCTPLAATDAPACSDTRGMGALGASSSVERRPGVKTAPVAEVRIKGRLEPTSAEPSVSMARLSISQTSLNFEKSWTNAVWITASDAATPLRRLSRSSTSPRWTLTLAPAAASDLAPASDRARPST